VLRVTGADGEVRAIFTSYACHCTTIGIDAIHGDWAGCAQEALQREFPGAIALTALGLRADQNPNPRRTMELVVQYGEALGAGAKRLVKSDLKPVNGPLECRTKHIELAFDKLPGREEWQHSPPRRHRPLRIMQRRISHDWIVVKRFRASALPGAALVLRNDLAMVFLPGEVTVDYSLRIKCEFDRSRLWVNGYSNDVPCYLPSRACWRRRVRGWGAMIYYDRPTKFASDVEERIMSAVHELMPKEFLAKPDQVTPTASAPAIAYPDHSNLLVVRDASGTERPVKTPVDWAERVAHIKANLQLVMGPLHDTSRWAPLDVEVVSEEKMEKYLRRKIRFNS